MNTKDLYNSQADSWSRNEPVLLSDYSARPFVINLCEPIDTKRILDIGCGEGYVGRRLAMAGAKHVHGIDISDKMIEAAKANQINSRLKNLSYEVQDIRNAELSGEEPFDLVLGMFLFNYLSVEDTHLVMKKAFDVIKLGGHFIFSVPHPFLAFLKKDKYPFYFEATGGYFSGRNSLFPGEIWRRDGISVNVQCIHKTFEDYFKGLGECGFTAMPEIHELRITDDQVKLDPSFFGPLLDYPLHVAFKVKK